MLKRYRIIALILSVLLAFPLIPAPITDAASTVVYVKDGGSGTGKSASSPLGSLKTAINTVSPTGGTVVVCGPTSVSSGIVPNTHTEKVIITSLYGGTDYAKTANAKIVFTANIKFCGPTEFNNITLAASVKDGATNMSPFCQLKPAGCELILGDGINSTLENGCQTYLSVTEGANNQKITVNSGHWQRFRGNDDNTSSSVNLTVNGGTFHEKLILTGEKANYTTNVTAVINGGEFLGGIYLAAFEKDGDFQPAPSFEGNVSITVNGGNIYGPLSWSYRRLGTFSGSYNVTLNGGGLHHITEIYGPNVNSTLTYGNGVDPSAVIKGEESFTTCLRAGADPYVFFHDGMYYFVSTGGSSIGLACAANLSDLGKAAKTPIFVSPKITVNDSKISKYQDAWSPEIHHFTDEEVGAGNGGWYMFLGLTDQSLTYPDGTSAASKQREYVLKCLDGDYLLGRWGSLDGEVNVPTKIEFTGTYEDYENGATVTKTYNKESFCAGMSILRYDGKVYLTFVNERGRDESSPRFYQTIDIVEITKNDNGKHPLGYIYGQPVTICEPEADWEKGGLSTTKRYPEVVEGCSAVYGEDGSVYLVYTGSGYWSDAYALGYMKLTGSEPAEKASWTKSANNPILQAKPEAYRDSNSVNGSGHGSYFTDAEGNMWVCYHGYVGTNTSSGRYAHLERIYVSSEGVSIGGEGIYPADANTTLTEPVNYLPLEARASGFTTVTYGEEVPQIEGASLTLTNSIAINFMVKNAHSSLYSDVRMVFEADGETEERYPEDCREIDGLTAFSFYNVTPDMMVNNVRATLYATYEGVEYVLDTLDYSVTEYCYGILANDEHADLHTLIVDMLNYGAETQKYVDPETDAAKLANAGLDNEKKALASEDKALTNSIAIDKALADPKAEWTTAGLSLGSIVAVKAGFSAKYSEGLNVRITVDGKEYTVTKDYFTWTDGGFAIRFDGLNPAQLSEAVELTVYDGDTPISNTLTYSAESYAYAMQNDAKLGALVKAMMRYGRSVADCFGNN